MNLQIRLNRSHPKKQKEEGEEAIFRITQNGSADVSTEMEHTARDDPTDSTATHFPFSVRWIRIWSVATFVNKRQSQG